MIGIRKGWPLIGLALLLSWGCLQPEREALWELDLVGQADTRGYCRDIFLQNDTAFVAAGQAGVQLWDISDVANPILLQEFNLVSDLGLTKEIMQVQYAPQVQQLFALENNERPLQVDLSLPDTSILIGQISSEQTKEFVVLDQPDSFTVYAADFDDGLKWSFFTYDTTYKLWVNTKEGEIPGTGPPNGVAYYQGLLVLTLGQLGVDFYYVNGLSQPPEFLGTIDTEGFARSVTIVDPSTVYVACEEGGVYQIELAPIIKLQQPFSPDNYEMIRFATDLDVDDIAVDGHQAALCLGSKGLALYDLTQPDEPVSRGIFNIGHAYHATFSQEYLFVATREGMQIFNITE
ncbi:MAG: hypothetical protein ACE5DP_03905 [Fidelibacterota bacterium]